MASREVVLNFGPAPTHMATTLRGLSRPTWQFGPDAAEHPTPCRWPEESCRGHVTSYPQVIHRPSGNYGPGQPRVRESYPQAVDKELPKSALPVQEPECDHIWRIGETEDPFCVRCRARWSASCVFEAER